MDTYQTNSSQYSEGQRNQPPYGYPQQPQSGYQQQRQNSYPLNLQNSYSPQQQNGYSPQQQNGYPQQQQNGYQQQRQNSYPSQQQNGYSPQQQGGYQQQQRQSSYPPQQQNDYQQYQNNYPPQQQNNYPPQQQNGYQNGYSQPDQAVPQYGGSNGYGGQPPYQDNRNSDQGQKTKNQNKVIDWASENLPTFIKDFYEEHPSVTARHPDKVRAIRERANMKIEGRGIPNPITHFDEAGFYPVMTMELKRLGYQGPTAVQAQGWPMALSGRDIVCVAETGSGKTLGYALPGIIHMMAQPPVEAGQGPIGLVLAPSRELATQIEAEFIRFTELNFNTQKINIACVYGGAAKAGQLRSLKQPPPDLIIATPGRLKDLYKSGHTSLKRVTYLVLDEADRMLIEPFAKDVEYIMDQIRPDRQVLMWSATWPKSVEQFSSKYLKDYIQVSIGALDNRVSDRISQRVDICSSEENEKTSKLCRDLSNIASCPPDLRKTIVFVGKTATADKLTNYLTNNGFRACVIYGKKKQEERERALELFRTGQAPTLVATNVVARGIDVKGVKFVINYDFPDNIEDYVHRVGRTGRGGDTGNAITYFTHEDIELAKDLIEVLQKTNQQVNPGLIDMAQNPEKYSQQPTNNKQQNNAQRSVYNGNNNNVGNGYTGGNGYNGDNGGHGQNRDIRYDSYNGDNGANGYSGGYRDMRPQGDMNPPTQPNQGSNYDPRYQGGYSSGNNYGRDTRYDGYNGDNGHTGEYSENRPQGDIKSPNQPNQGLNYDNRYQNDYNSGNDRSRDNSYDNYGGDNGYSGGYRDSRSQGDMKTPTQPNQGLNYDNRYQNGYNDYN